MRNELLNKKFLGGSSVFPVSDTEKGEGIKHWLSDPFSRAYSVNVDRLCYDGRNTQEDIARILR